MITEQAEARVAEMRERGARLRMANRDETADAIRLRMGHLAELKERKAAQDQALKNRKAAERPHAADVKAMSAKLSKSDDAIVKAIHDAARELGALFLTVRGHNDAIGAVHARLAELGLPLGDETVDCYETGHGSGGTLRLNGTTGTPIPPDTLTMYAVSQVMAEAFGPKHPEARVRDARIHSLLRASNSPLKAA
ncbi:hypothetical protein ACWEBX_16950 [Streptomyces sp. NPDC005070]